MIVVEERVFLLGLSPAVQRIMDAPHLDKQYAAFGKVTEGMDVVDAIARTPRSMFNDKPTHEQKMKTVTVETFGVEYPEPETC